jgi:hypothetical protein
MIDVSVMTLSGEIVSLGTSATDSIYELKLVLAKRLGIPVAWQVLFFEEDCPLKVTSLAVLYAVVALLCCLPLQNQSTVAENMLVEGSGRSVDKLLTYGLISLCSSRASSNWLTGLFYNQYM